MKIWSAQNVGKILTGRKNNLPRVGPFWQMFQCAKKTTNVIDCLAIFLGGPIGSYLPGLESDVSLH